MATPLLGLLKASGLETILYNVSAREWRAVREGDTHAASKTSTNNTPESFIVGIGASGALLASAAIVFVTLVGIVSFNVWPTGNEGSVGVNVELSNAATPSRAPSGAAVPVSAAAGQVASATVPVASAGGGNSGTGTGDSGQGGGGKGSTPKGGVTSPPVATTPPSTGDTGDSGGDTGAPAPATKSPAHPVHPTHPENPHQNIPDGTNGKDDPSAGDDSDDVVHGKGRFSRPAPPSSSSSDSSSSGDATSETGRGRGAPRFRH